MKKKFWPRVVATVQRFRWHFQKNSIFNAWCHFLGNEFSWKPFKTWNAWL